MATFESVLMAHQTLQNLEQLRQDMRRNAQAYKSFQAAGRPIAQIAAVMQADAAQYLRRLQWQKDIADTPARRTRLLDGLSAWGISEAEAISFYQTMKAAADGQAAAVITTGADVIAAADAVLAAVAPHDQVFQP